MNWLKPENFCLRLQVLNQPDIKPSEMTQRESDETLHSSVKICLEFSILHVFQSNKRNF